MCKGPEQCELSGVVRVYSTKVGTVGRSLFIGHVSSWK